MEKKLNQSGPRMCQQHFFWPAIKSELCIPDINLRMYVRVFDVIYGRPKKDNLFLQVSYKSHEFDMLCRANQ